MVCVAPVQFSQAYQLMPSHEAASAAASLEPPPLHLAGSLDPGALSSK